MKHYAKFFGGIGSVFIIYAPLRLLEDKPAIFFILVFCMLSYGLGFLLERES